MSIIRNSPNVYMFDHDVMKRFGIKESALPKGSVVLNKPQTLISQYWPWILGIAAAGVVQTFLILALLYLWKRSKASKDALLKSESLLKGLRDNIPDLVWLKDQSGIYLACNPAFERLYGAKEESILGRSDHDFVDSERADAFRENDRKAMEAGRPVRNEEQLVFADTGHKGLFETVKAPMFDASGEFIGVLGIARDISERERAALALRQSESSFRSLFDSMADIIWVCSANGRIIEVNPAAIRILGHSREELQRMNVMDVHPLDSRQEAQAIFAEMIAGLRKECPLPLVRKDGSLVPVETRIWFGNWHGEECLFGISKDLSAEVEAKQRFELLFRNNPAPMALSSLPERGFIDVNEAFLHVTGYTREEVIGNTSCGLDLFVRESHQSAISDMLQATGRVSDFELELRSKDGSTLNGLLSGDAISIQGRGYFLSVMIDVTERKRAEEELRLQSERLRDLVEWKNSIFNVPAVSILVVTQHRVIAEVNRGFEEMFGYTSNEIYGQSFEIIHKDIESSQVFGEKHWQGISRSNVVTAEWPLKKKCGEVFWCALFGSALDMNDLRQGAVWVITDITARKRAEEAERRESADRDLIGRLSNAAIKANDLMRFQQELLPLLGEALDVSRAYVFTFRQDGKTMDNTAEWTAPGVIPQKDNLLDIPADPEWWWIATLMRGEDIQFRDVEDIPDERTISDLRLQGILSILVIPLFIGTRFCGFMGLDECRRNREWTSEERDLLAEAVRILVGVWAEDELRQSEKRFRTLLGQAPIPMCYSDKSGAITYRNTSFLEVIGYAKDEMPTTREWWSKAYPDEKYRNWAIAQWSHAVGKTASTGGDIEPMEYRVTCKDRSVRTMLIGGIAIGEDLLVTFIDITDRKQAEEALRLRESYLTAIIENQPGLVWLKDCDGRFLAVNRKFALSCGKPSPEALVGQTDLEIWPIELASKYQQDDQSVMQAGQPTKVEEIVYANGEERWFETFKMPVWGKQGGVVGTTGFAHDITERKEAEDTLRKSQEHLQAIFRVTPTGIGVVKDRILVRVNQLVCDMTGYSEEELLGRSAQMLYPELEDFDFVGQEKYRQISEKGTGEVETRWIRKDGAIIDLLMRSTPLDPRDLSLGVTFTAMDITERKRAEEALSRSEARFRMLFDNISAVAVQGYDQNRTVVYWNETSARFYGYSREEAIGQKLEDLIIPPHMRPVVIESVRAWGEENSAIPAGELSLMRKDGTFISVYSSHVMQRLSDSSSIMYCLDLDLSELTAARAELVRAKERAEAANRSKSLFLANMSHELRTPLNGVLSMLQLISGSEVPGEVELYAEMATRAGQRLTSLLADILDLSRIEAGRMPIASKPFALADIITALAETFSPMHYSKSLPLVINASPEVPPDVVGDEIRVRQILFNLVGNAMKFTDQGEVRVDVSTLLPRPSGRARLLFIISDTGLGIPDDQIDQICRPFIQVSSDFTRSHQGAGLGLSIARRLIDAMGGTLTIESMEGQGTNVYLMLPFSLPESATLPAPSESAHGAEPVASLRLLLVEDEEISRLGARLHLEKLGHQVVTTNNGEEALEALRGGRYDCVLMDIQMDVMDGLEATRRIRAGTSGVLDAQIPIVAMTAYAMTGDRETFLEAGMTDYVAKPVQVEELKRALGRVVATK